MTAIQQPLFAALPIDPVGSNEWYTPPHIIEMARAGMGSIDTDPSSCPRAQETVKASRYFDAETNGLNQEWLGNVWLNPPYSRGLIDQFIDKLIREQRTSNMFLRATVLVNASMNAKWMHRLMGAASLMCVVDHRIQFYGPNMSGSGNSYDSLLFYVEAQTKNAATKYRWAAEFSEIGKVVQI